MTVIASDGAKGDRACLPAGRRGNLILLQALNFEPLKYKKSF